MSPRQDEERNAAAKDTPADLASQNTAAPAGELIARTPMQTLMASPPLVVDQAWWIDGAADSAVLASAMTGLHRRHEALRARSIVSGPGFGHAMAPPGPGDADFRELPPAGSDELDRQAPRGRERTDRAPDRVNTLQAAMGPCPDPGRGPVLADASAIPPGAFLVSRIEHT